MNQNNIHNINTINNIRNYANQHIYNLISIRDDKITPEEKRIKLQAIFKELINKIRFITNTNEVDVINAPMGIIFQHIKPTIIKLIANCLPKVDKLFIEKGLIYNFEWSIRLFKSLQYLGSKDIIIWFFLHIPYYNEFLSNTDKIRDNYYKILEWMYINYPEELYLSENEFVFLSNQTCMPYALSYHNKNNVELLTLYSKLIRKICPFVNYFSPRVAESIIKKQNKIHTPPTQSTQSTQPIQITSNTQKKRICFISDSFTTDTSVLRDRISIIGKLDRNKYDVYFASFYRFEEINGLIAKVFMNKIKDNYIALGTTLTYARETLEKLELDIIIYPDIGMKLMPTLLAYSRIAPVQITTWGHSETSGIDTIDYFVSSHYFAGTLSFDEIQKQYSEKLILFKSLGTFYINPHKLFIENNKDYQNNTNTNTCTKKFKTREELGFTSKDHLYVCLQTFYKLNPEFETCLARILELDPNGIILFSNTFPYCKSHLERIRTIMGLEKIKRLKWYGSLEKDEFLNIVSISDVCLDPFPFGGCNTSYDAFAYNIPVITYPSEFLHGQFTNGLYKKMGSEKNIDMTECCVSSADDYAQLASRIGLNEKLKHKISRNIEMNKYLIFQEQESIDEWNIFLSF